MRWILSLLPHYRWKNWGEFKIFKTSPVIEGRDHKNLYKNYCVLYTLYFRDIRRFCMLTVWSAWYHARFQRWLLTSRGRVPSLAAGVPKGQMQCLKTSWEAPVSGLEPHRRRSFQYFTHRNLLITRSHIFLDVERIILNYPLNIHLYGRYFQYLLLDKHSSQHLIFS